MRKEGEPFEELSGISLVASYVFYKDFVAKTTSHRVLQYQPGRLGCGRNVRRRHEYRVEQIQVSGKCFKTT